MNRWHRPAAVIVAAVLGINLVLAGPAAAAARPMNAVEVTEAGGSYPADAWNEVAREILWRHRGPITKCGFPLGGIQRQTVRVAVRRIVQFARTVRHASGVCATTWEIAQAVGRVVQIGLLDGNDFHVSDVTEKTTRPYLRPNRCDITIQVGASEEDTEVFGSHYYIC